MIPKSLLRMAIKTVAPDGSFTGSLAVYNNVDLGGDLIETGAFTKTIKEHGDQVPLLWQHKPDMPIGMLTLVDGPDALSVKGQLLMDLPAAKNAYLLIKARIVRGLSIGFDTVKDAVDQGVRHLKEIRLWEGSIVTFPMNEMAQITSVKARKEAKADFTTEYAEIQLQDAMYQMWIALRYALTSIPWSDKANLEGVDAVRAATVANAILGLTYNRTAAQLKQMGPELEKLTALLTRKQTADLVESTNSEVFALKQEVAMKRIAADAAGQFVEVQRQAALVVKLYAINQQLATATDTEAIAALKAKRQLIIDLTNAEWSEEDAKAAIALRSPIEQYQEEINQLNREVAAMKTAQGGNLTYVESLQVAAHAQDAFNKATDETVKLMLRFGGIRDGVNAFFLDMEKSAKSAASVIYEALHSAFDKLSDQLATLLTGGKTDFKKMFQSIGKEMVGSSIKSTLQTGLGALGGKLGINLGGALGGKPDGTKGNPWWVRMAKDAGINLGGGGDAGSSDDPGAPGAGADAGAGVFAGLLGKASGFLGPLMKAFLGGSGGGGGFGQLAGAFAGGGDMAPDKAYVVGDNGPEIKMGNRIVSNSASRRMLEGNASNHYYTIDARGTDPVLTEQRTKAAILSAHNSAVRASAQVHSEKVMRTPQRR